MRLAAKLVGCSGLVWGFYALATGPLGMPGFLGGVVAICLAVMAGTPLLARVDEVFAVFQVRPLAARAASQEEIERCVGSLVRGSGESFVLCWVLVLPATVVLTFALAMSYVPWWPSSVAGGLIWLFVLGLASVLGGIPLSLPLMFFLMPDRGRVASTMVATGYGPLVAVAATWRQEEYLGQYIHRGFTSTPGIRELLLCAEPGCPADEAERLAGQAARLLREDAGSGSGRLADFVEWVEKSRSAVAVRALAAAQEAWPDQELAAALESLQRCPRLGVSVKEHRPGYLLPPEIVESGQVAWTATTHEEVRRLASAAALALSARGKLADELEKAIVERIELTNEETAIASRYGSAREHCLEKAKELQSAGKWNEAIPYCRVLASVHPEHAQYWTMAAVCEQQMWQAVVSTMVPAAAYEGSVADQIGALQRVRDLLPTEHLWRAVAYLNRALQADHDEHMAWYLKAGCLCGIGMVADDAFTVRRGLRCYDEALRTRPDDRAARTDKARYTEVFLEMAPQSCGCCRPLCL